MASKARKPYVINKAGGQTAEILLYDQIGDGFWSEGITAKSFALDLRKAGKVKTINVRINSPGGSVFDGLAIYNALREHSATVNVYIDGMALSIASVIAMSGDTVYMADNALIMIHNPRGAVAGSAEEIASYVTMLSKLRDSIVSAYKNKTDMEEDDLVELMDAETWMSADEAIDKGFADELTGAKAVAARAPIPEFLNVPVHVQDKLSVLSQKTGAKNMSEGNASAGDDRIPATLQQLKALKGATSDFVIAQLEANTTLEEAMIALVDQLAGQLAQATARITQLETQQSQKPAEGGGLAKEPPPQSPVDAAADQPAKAPGAPPLDHAGPPKDTVPDQPWGKDPVAFAKQKAREVSTARGIPVHQAFNLVLKEFPGIADAMNA